MPKVKQVSPTLTEKEAELVRAVVFRELRRVQGGDYEIIEPDPFEGHPPSVRRRLVDRLGRAHDKLQEAINPVQYLPAIATTPEKGTDIITEIA